MNDRTSTDNDDVRAGDRVHAGGVEITRVIEWLGSKTVDELFPDISGNWTDDLAAHHWIADSIQGRRDQPPTLLAEQR